MHLIVGLAAEVPRDSSRVVELLLDYRGLVALEVELHLEHSGLVALEEVLQLELDHPS